jgi:hypothetical protein
MTVPALLQTVEPSASPRKNRFPNKFRYAMFSIRSLTPSIPTLHPAVAGPTKTACRSGQTSSFTRSTRKKRRQKYAPQG